jgi:hypothetical protein
MTQSEIDQAVAQSLGEDIHEIRGHGFSLIDPHVEFFDPECDAQEPQVIDWDAPVSGATVQSLHEVAA